jgi:tRNA threonylcarbamoyladenosine biosynthesis protein TsaB
MAKKMNLLALDTSTSRASVALCVDGVMFLEEEENLRAHARVLLAMVERVLLRASITLDKLDGLVFGEGPGSFTGLRIACSVAKGLAYAHDLPLYPVSGLRAIAAVAKELDAVRVLPENMPVLAMMDARMNQVYWAFDANVPVQTAHVSAAEDVCVPEGVPFILAGVLFEPYLDKLPHAVRGAMLGSYTCFPRADIMIQRVKTDEIEAVTADAAMPAYVRQQVTGGRRRE